MNTLFNQIALKQRLKVFVKQGAQSNPKHALALMADISQLGFKLDKTLAKRVSTLSQKDIKSFHKLLVSNLSKMVGSHVRYTPLFRNFPEDVPEHNEYLFKRIVGFLQNFLYVETENYTALSCGCKVDSDLFDVDIFGACPICQMQTDLVNKPLKRKALKEKVTLKTISFIEEDSLNEIIKELFNIKSSMSTSLKEDLESVFAQLKNNVKNYLPKEVMFKENMATLSGLVVKHTDLKLNSDWFKTSTDVLRFAVQLSEGDVSLKEDSKFKLSNKQRKAVLSLLEGLNFNPLEDMLRYRQKWLRLGEYLHVGALQVRYPKTYAHFKVLRGEGYKSIPTFNKEVHASTLKVLDTNKVTNAFLEKLATRPGEFARRLDFLLRETQSEKVLTYFEEIVGKVATPLLLKLSKYLESRTEESEFRYFIPKGNVAKIKMIEGDDRKTISKDLVKSALSIIKIELNTRFNKGEKLKKVYIDESLKKILVPFAQRSASKSLSTVERGSRIAFDSKAKTLRLFMYWHENDNSGRIDVDLSAAAYDKDWKYVTNVSWTSIKSIESVHSGDIQSAPNGASEFIDINVDSFRKNKIRYVMMNVFSWTGQSFKDYECFAGVMERKSPKSGEAYEPKTVKNKFDISGDSTVNAPLMIDLETNEIVWCDLSLGKGRGRRVEGNEEHISNMGKVVSSMQDTYPNLFELFSAHAKANGAVVHIEKKEGVNYDLEMTSEKAKDITEILSKWI